MRDYVLNKKCIVGLIGAVFMLPMVTPASAAAKVGYADMEQALAATKAGKKARKQMDREVAKRRKKLENARGEVVKLETAFKKQELILSEASKEKKKKEYLKKIENLQQLVSESEQEMQRVQQEIAGPILLKMSEVLKKISKEKKYDVVVAKNALLYADDKHDLTKELIKRFDEEFKGK